MSEVEIEREACAQLADAMGNLAGAAAEKLSNTEAEFKWRAVQDACADIADAIRARNNAKPSHA